MENSTALGWENASEGNRRWDWLKLVDYGEYGHRLGVQVVDREGAVAMADRFRSLWARLARRFRGIPVYVGHPDDGEFRGQVGHSDTKAYGWVQQLEAREDGLWIRVRWSPTGRQLLEGAHYKFLSPRWEMERREGDRLYPKSLLSVGLTNCPNMALEAIANGDFSPEFVQKIESEMISFTKAPSIFAAANCCPISGLLDPRPVLSADLHRRRSGRSGHRYYSAGRQLLTLVNERMTKIGESYGEAWRAVREERPDLFDGPSNS
ncbi:MAG: phage protease [Puniceicoccales bacterium]|nr:phage protease [Puniceicoccales bacterium]